MWRKGTLYIKGIVLSYSAKVYDEGSEFGINNGRISKLEIRKDGELILNYDRGWDIKPEGDIAETALLMILDYFK